LKIYYENQFYNDSAAERDKSFLVQQFFKNAAEVEGEKPSSLPAGSETLCATALAHRRLILRMDFARRISCATLRFDRCR
jgi:hypothetical protein